MLMTAENVSRTYGISREVQDEYAALSQVRTARAQTAGAFDDKIVPITAIKRIKNRETGEENPEDVTLSKDEGNRPGPTADILSQLNPIIEGGVITAGNASQLSDGASACVIMESKIAEQLGLTSLAIYRGMAVAGNTPKEMVSARFTLFQSFLRMQVFASKILYFGN